MPEIERRVLETIDFEKSLLHLAKVRGLAKGFPYLYTMLSPKVGPGKAEASRFQALSDRCSNVRIRMEKRSSPGGS